MDETRIINKIQEIWKSIGENSQSLEYIAAIIKVSMASGLVTVDDIGHLYIVTQL